MRVTARPPGGRGPVQGAAFSWPPLEGMEAPAGLPAHVGPALHPSCPGCLRLQETKQQRQEGLGPQGLAPTWHMDLVPAAQGVRTGAQLPTGLLPIPGAHCSDSAAPLAPWSYTKPRAFVVLRCKGHIGGQAGQVHDHFCFAFLSPASSLQRPESSWPNQTVYSGRSTALPAPRTVWARTGSRALTCTGGESPRPHDVGVATL